jgi:ATP-dependent protease ClpP protease subunit
LNGSTSISLSGQTGATIQWQRSENSGSSWSNITGATSSSYTTPNLITPTSYRANVTNGSCSAAPSSAAAVSIVEANTSNASSATYNSAWSNSQNDNTTGLGAWTLSTIGTAGFFTGSSDVNNGGTRSWGMFASGGSNVASAVRPVSLSVGNTLSFSMDNGSIENGKTIGFALQNSNGQNLAELLFIGGQSFYQIIDAAGTTNTSIAYTAGGLDVSVTYTAENTYAIFVTGKGGATTSYTGRTFATQAGGQIPAQIRFFNAGAGTGSGSDLFFNSLSISNPVITAHPSNTAQNVCLNSSATALTVGASGTSLTYQWYSNANASNSGGTLINSATSSSYTPSSAVVGALYYYCVVTNGSCGSATSRVSGAITVVTSTTSISPNNTQNISMSTSGTPLTVSTGTAPVSSRAWKYSTTSGSGYEAFSPAQTGTTYTPNFATSGTFYVVCEVTYGNSCGVITSNEVQVTVVPNAISTASITGTQFCAGATDIAVPFTYAGTENFPSATFKAQLSNSNGSFVTPVDLQTVASNSSGSQSILITIPSNTADGTGYRIRVISDNPVLNGTDNGVNLTINSPSVGGSVSGGATVCSGVNNTSLTLSGSTGSVTKWQSSTAPDFSATVSDIANTTTSLIASNLTATAYYRAVVTNGVCASANSSTATITVNQTSVGGAVSGGSAICVGATSASLSLSGNTGTITKWQSAVSPFNAWTDIANTAGLSVYTSGALSQTTRFRAVVTNGVCSAANSAGASVTVDQSNADAGAYTSSWAGLSNDEVTGLNSWILQNTGASG